MIKKYLGHLGEQGRLAHSHVQKAKSQQSNFLLVLTVIWIGVLSTASLKAQNDEAR